ncbi:hypothetical protein WJX72_007134 [[Myrmecia] bisecta]|uniref:DUF221-domain-containing protein n=1 Tax=[Myrmecia] bisecta TaxID=41462 RepID=A0AAW1PT48_9CHLO
MATDARAFAISLGFNSIICLAVLLFFGIFRTNRYTQKFYAPKRYMRGLDKRPLRLPRTFWGWLKPVHKYTQKEIIELAGMDAAMYLRVLTFGAEFFFFVTIWCLVVVLPTNLSGNNVDRLLGTNGTPTSNFTYWVSPPSPPPPGATPSPPRIVAAPNFYQQVPPAPAGLQWWHYRPEVPPLPDPASYLHDPNYTTWGWRYDSSFIGTDYTFTNLDRSTMSNISSHDDRLWVHLLSAWVISLYAWQLLSRYNREAVALRIQYLTTVPKGAESHSVLVRELPCVAYGTVEDRVDKTLLKFLPGVLKRRLIQNVKRTAAVTARGLDKGLSFVATSIIPDAKAVSPQGQAANGPQKESSQDLKFYDASATTLPVYSGTAANAPHLDGPEAASPQHLRITIEPGTVHTGNVEQEGITELDAWRKCERKLQQGRTLRQVVEEEFEELYPGLVAKVHLVHDTRELDATVQEYENVRQKLIDVLDDYISKSRRHITIKRRMVTVLGVKHGSWGRERFGKRPSRVDALEYYPAKLRELVRLMEERQRAARQRFVPTAFVTFKTRRAQVVAVTSQMHHDVSAWDVDAAPAPEEIVWRNLGWREWERKLRNTIIWVAFAALAIFYVVPVAALQAIIQVDKLESVPGIKQLASLPLISDFFKAILPSLVLRIFLAILPLLLAFMNRRQGMISESQVDFGVVRKYFIFQVITVFFASFVAGSFLTQIQQFVKDPGSVVKVLGTGAPSTAIFFTTYLLLNGLTIEPLKLLRVWGLLLFRIRTALSSTERAKARLWQNQYFSYGRDLPHHTIAILLGLAFCVVAPIIAPVALAYFLVTSIVNKYQMVYVFTKRYESGGKVWRQVFEQIIVSLIIFQLMMIGLMGLKGGLPQTLLTLPLLLFTLLFRQSWVYTFDEQQQVLSLRAAADLDRRDRTLSPPTEDEQAKVDQYYISPSFASREQELAELLAEAKRMDAHIEGRAVLQEEEDRGSETDDAESVRGDPEQAFYPASSRSLDPQITPDTPSSSTGAPNAESVNSILLRPGVKPDRTASGGLSALTARASGELRDKLARAGSSKPKKDPSDMV